MEDRDKEIYDVKSKHTSEYPCYKSPIQYSADVCEDCEYDSECYKKFLDWLSK